MSSAILQPIRTVGRYALYHQIAAGGMATVHFGRLLGPGGFSRTVAIKRMHPHLAKDPEFNSMFLDEARVAARIRHPNVIGTIDVVALEDELFLVMDYVPGESLSRLLRGLGDRKERLPVRIALSIEMGILHGLNAAHEARSEKGELMKLVHRDVSPQNVLVGIDGTPRLLDFGIAKVAGRVQHTRDGQLKGKIAYMSPEQLSGEIVDSRTDIYAASVILWEMLSERRLCSPDLPAAAIMHKILTEPPLPPSTFRADVPSALDAIVMRGLSPARDERFATAREMAVALEAVHDAANAREVGDWVEASSPLALHARAAMVAEIESVSSQLDPAAGRTYAFGDCTDGLEPPTTMFEPGKASRASSPSVAADGSHAPPAEDGAGSVENTLFISQVTSLSGSITPKEEPPKPARPWSKSPKAIFALSAVALIGTSAGAVGMLGRTEGPAKPAGIPAAPITTTSETAGAALNAPSPESTTRGSNEVPAASQANASSDPAPPPAASSAGHPPEFAGSFVAKERKALKQGGLLGAPGAGKKVPKAADACRPPWTLDQDGIRHPKLECL